MIGPLFAKTIRDARLLFISVLLLLFFFPWFFVAASSLVSMPAFAEFVTRAFPDDLQRVWGVPFSDVATLGSPTFLPSRELQNSYTLSENVTWVRGQHTWKYGTEIRREEFTISQPMTMSTVGTPVSNRRGSAYSVG